MNNFLEIYIWFALIVGTCYLQFWIRYLKPDIIKDVNIFIKIIIYISIYAVGTVLTPIAIYDIMKYNYKGEKQ